MNKEWGSKAKSWGAYEWKRLWGTAWPMLVSLAVVLLTTLATDVSTDVSLPAGAVVGLFAKWLQQYTADNTQNRL
jgi:hypothetical protein